MSARPVAVVTVLAVCAVAAPARAADPIMPLSQVRKGMKCTGLSVVRGTDISSFDVEVLDVVAGDESARQPLILVRVSGPAVDATGIAEGFSGSPVICPDDDGVQRFAGAIAFASGDYGGHVALATPIESVLGLPVDPPKSTRRNAKAARRARPLAMPLAVAGLSAPVAAGFRRLATRAHRRLSTAPFAPITSAFPPQQIRPGASLAVGLASGDLTAGAVGTVTYVDGDKVWGFGHPFDAVGRRALLLKDAWVYTVVGNPIDAQDLTSYKLAAPGHDLGTFSNDAPSAVVGRVGVLPARFPLRITSKDEDTGRVLQRNISLVDENAAGLPPGASPLSLVGPVAVAQAVYDTLRGSPSQQSGRMCVRIKVRERKQQMGFCNAYVGGSPSSSGAPMAGDFANAATMLDGYNFGVLHITGVDVDLTLRRDLRQAYLTRVRAPQVLRRGKRVRISLVARRVRGAQVTRSFTFRVPRGARRGTRDLVLSGAPADSGGYADTLDALAGVFDLTLGEPGSDGRGPSSIAALARNITRLEREDGVTASFLSPGESHQDADAAEYLAYRDPLLRLTGTVRTTVRVAAAARRPRHHQR